MDDRVGNEPAGRVIVLASNGYTDTSMGGGTKLLRLHQNGCAGVLTDGRLRDVSADSSGAVLSPDGQIGEVLAEARKVEATDAAARDQIAREMPTGRAAAATSSG